jgi:hypothetical protein
MHIEHFTTNMHTLIKWTKYIYICFLKGGMCKESIDSLLRIRLNTNRLLLFTL